MSKVPRRASDCEMAHVERFFFLEEKMESPPQPHFSRQSRCRRQEGKRAAPASDVAEEIFARMRARSARGLIAALRLCGRKKIWKNAHLDYLFAVGVPRGRAPSPRGGTRGRVRRRHGVKTRRERERGRGRERPLDSLSLNSPARGRERKRRAACFFL